MQLPGLSETAEAVDLCADGHHLSSSRASPRGMLPAADARSVRWHPAARDMVPHPLERFHRLIFRFGRRLDIPDFDVRALLPDSGERNRIQTNVGAALVLMRDRAPVRYAHLRRDLPRISVAPTQHLAQCLYGVGICLLQFDYVVSATTTAEELALTLIHEGTHARLKRAGFGYAEAIRARVERLCVLAEIVFACRLPGSEPLIADAQRRAARPAEFWSDAASQARDLKTLRQLGGVARVAATIAAFLVRRRRRKGAA